MGCIPSKALLESSENYERVAHKFGAHGISVTGAKMDVKKMQARKDKIVTQLTGGIQMLFRKNKVTWLKGHGTSGAAGGGAGGERYRIEVSAGGAAETVEATHVIIATGSTARELPGVPVDNEVICDNVGALAFRDVPKRLGVIGAGVIGLELGSVWRRLGAKVTILEALPTFLAACDDAVSKEAWKVFTKEQGLEIRLGVKIGKVTRQARREGGVRGRRGPESPRMRQAGGVGRARAQHEQPRRRNGGTEDRRSRLHRGGRALPHQPAQGVRGRRRGARPDARAQGHGRRRDGRRAHRQPGRARGPGYHSLGDLHRPRDRLGGQDRAAARRPRARPTGSGRYRSWPTAGRSARTRPTGFVKILADAKTDRVLGVHIISSHASELIAEAVMAMEFRASSEDIARICHAHPSLSEVMHEAALAVDKRALHYN